jgi:hypothetical protein
VGFDFLCGTWFEPMMVGWDDARASSFEGGLRAVQPYARISLAVAVAPSPALTYAPVLITAPLGGTQPCTHLRAGTTHRAPRRYNDGCIRMQSYAGLDPARSLLYIAAELDVKPRVARAPGTVTALAVVAGAAAVSSTSAAVSNGVRPHSRATAPTKLAVGAALAVGSTDGHGNGSGVGNDHSDTPFVAPDDGLFHEDPSIAAKRWSRCDRAASFSFRFACVRWAPRPAGPQRAGLASIVLPRP